MQSSWFTALQEQFNTINMDFIQSMTERLNGVLNLTFSGIGSVFGIVGEYRDYTDDNASYSLLFIERWK